MQRQLPAGGDAITSESQKSSIFTDGYYCLEPAQQTQNSEWEVPAQCDSIQCVQ